MIAYITRQHYAGPARSTSSAIGFKPQQQNGDALKYCATELQRDLKIRTIATVRKNGQALKDTPEEMKEDRDVCKAAVAQNGHWQAIEWAFAEMKKDEQIIIAAASNYNKQFPRDEPFDFKSKIGIFSRRMGIPDKMWQNASVRSAAGL